MVNAEPRIEQSQSRSRLLHFSGSLGLSLILFAFVLLAIPTSVATAQSPDESNSLYIPQIQAGSDGERAGSLPYAPGQVIVGVGIDAVGAAATWLDGARSLGEFGVSEVTASSVQPALEAFIISTPDGDELATIAELQEQPGVLFAEPNWIVTATGSKGVDGYEEAPVTVNDPLYHDHQWYLQRIWASRGWQNSGGVAAQDTETPIMRVVVVDSGIDVYHPDLYTVVSRNFKNYITPGQQPIDDCGHGTHVAGLIGAEVNNGIGIAGTSDTVELIPFKALRVYQTATGNTCGGTTTNIAQAIRDSALAKYEIINLSLELSADSSLIKSAVEYAYARGSLMIAAAGNCTGSGCPKPVQYPAKYPQVMAVAATDYDNVRASYSSIGPELDIAAPGGNTSSPMLSTWSSAATMDCPWGEVIRSGATYCNDIGTSMSAGVVSGVAAQLWSVRPELTADDVRAILSATAQKIYGTEQQVGKGLVDADRAVRYALPSQLRVEPRFLSYNLRTGTSPFTTTLALTNASLEPMSWTITGTESIQWIQTSDPVSGTVQYGEPQLVPVVITPTHMASGAYRSIFSVRGETSDGETSSGEPQDVPVIADLRVYTPSVTPGAYLPWIMPSLEVPIWPYVDYHWEIPDTQTPGAMARVVRQVSQYSSIGITLPVTITIGSQIYADARIYWTGQVAVPASTSIPPIDSCRPPSSDYALLVDGWAANLIPNADEAQVSTFQAGPDRFVIEFANVPIEGNGNLRVSFQIVLYDNGSVGLNYARVPAMSDGEHFVVVGVQSIDSRFYNQIACKRDEIEIGALPSSYNSLILHQGDLY